MKYSTKYLKEVSCSFRFPEETVVWGSVFFGQFYEKIKDSFSEKEERKGHVPTRVSEDGSPMPSMSVVEEQVIFKSANGALAIMMSKQRISFHVVKGYKGFDDFFSKTVEPIYHKYVELGLGNGRRECSLVYYNQFNGEEGESTSDYILLASNEEGLGEEVVSNIQRFFKFENVIIVTKTFSGITNKKRTISYECGAVCYDQELMRNKDFKKQSYETHKPILAFFEKSVSDKVLEDLKNV